MRLHLAILTVATVTLLAQPLSGMQGAPSASSTPPVPSASSGALDSSLVSTAHASRSTAQVQGTDRDGTDHEPSRLTALLERIWGVTPWSGIPRVGSLPAGPRIVAAGDTVVGTVGARDGTLDVYGVVLGDAVAYEGDVVLHPGSLVAGDAVAVLGRVRLQGGVVGGEARSVRGSLLAPREVEPPTTAGRLGLVLGWLTFLVVIGVGVLVFASRPLAGVVETLHQSFLRSFLLGMAGQLAAAPALLLLVVGLAVTVIGILLIPFAIVALTLGAAGLMMLGFLAVAQVVGGALTGGSGSAQLSDRGRTLRALFVGIVAFIALWALAALATRWPVAAAILNGIALTLTWVAVTAGFGAALQSRGGTRRAVPEELEPEPEEELSWQTPTPIGGVVAARRPTPAQR